jgi:hypothetical protein
LSKRWRSSATSSARGLRGRRATPSLEGEADPVVERLLVNARRGSPPSRTAARRGRAVHVYGEEPVRHARFGAAEETEKGPSALQHGRLVCPSGRLSVARGLLLSSDRRCFRAHRDAALFQTGPLSTKGPHPARIIA